MIEADFHPNEELLLQTRLSAVTGVAAFITLLNVSIASGFAIAGLLEPELIAPAGTAPDGASAICR
jgi:hypothetical protein